MSEQKQTAAVVKDKTEIAALLTNPSVSGEESKKLKRLTEKPRHQHIVGQLE